MRIVVLGATGMAGSVVVTEALARGHHVTAASRRAPSDHDGSRLRHHAFDLTRPGPLAPLLEDADAAVLTVRLPAGAEAAIAPVTRRVLDAAAHHHVRVLVVGGAAPLRSPRRGDLLVLDDTDYVQDAWRPVAQASLDQLRVCTAHDHPRWVYLSPPAVLEPGERTGGYRRGATTLLTEPDGASRISAPDLAVAVLDELENPGAEQHFTVARVPPAS